MGYRDLIEQVLRRAGVKKLKPTHEGFIACCPFHKDSSPSFAINEEGAYICYSTQCGETGGLFGLLTKVGGYTHQEAFQLVKNLPRRGDLAKVGLLPPFEERHRRRLPKALEESSVKVYSGITPRYMFDRGFSPLTLAAFDVGYDIEQRQVVIPIRDDNGRLMGFVRRSVDVNAPRRYFVDVPRHGRRGVLFNIHRVAGREAVLVEGALDCMWCVQKGIRNTVALLGSYLSMEQEILLRRRFDKIVLMLDNDPAGYASTEKLISRLRWATVVVAAPFPKGKDAQDNTGRDLWGCVRNCTPGLQWLVQRRLHDVA